MVKVVSSGVKQKLLKELKNRIDGGDELAMDYGSRMQRANEGGFDINRVVTRGQKGSIYNQELKGFAESMPSARKGISVSDDTRVSDQFAGVSAINGATSYPMYTNVQNTFDFRKPGHLSQMSDVIPEEGIYLDDAGDRIHRSKDWLLNKIEEGSYKTIENPHINKLMKAAGFDSTYMREGWQSTAGPMKSGRNGLIGEDHYDTINMNVFDGSQLRSPNAAFDPAKKDSSNLLASVGAGVTGTAALTASDDSDASFIGMGAKTWNKGAEQLAKKMEAQGSDRHDIWQATGDMGAPMFRDVDGYLKQEISDNQSQWWRGKVKHPQGIYKNYDDLEGFKDLRDIQWVAKDNGSGGFYDPKSEVIAVSGDDSQKLSTGLHELQHAIQEREGFAKGGSPNALESDLKALAELNTLSFSEMDDFQKQMFKELRDNYGNVKDPYEAYKRLAGEAEARNVQERLNFDMQKRKAIPPWQTRDIAESDLIVRGNKPAAAAAGALTGSWALSSYGQDRANDAVKYGVPQVMETEETPNAEALANMIEKWSQTPIGSPLEGTSNYLRNLGRKQSTGTKVTNALGLAFDFL